MYEVLNLLVGVFIKVVMDPPQSDQPSATQDNGPQHQGGNLTTVEHHHFPDSPETVEQARIQHHVPLQEAYNGTNTMYTSSKHSL